MSAPLGFAIVGCVGYRGYYSQAEADSYAASVRAAGDDVFVYGGAADSNAAAHDTIIGFGPLTDAIDVGVTITAIDKAHSKVTLKGPEGHSVTVKVKDPKKLEGVAVGDLVQLTYTQALAIAVKPAAAK